MNKTLNELKQYLLKKFAGYSEEAKKLMSGIIEILYNGDSLFVQDSKGNRVPVRSGSIIPLTINYFCDTIHRFWDLGARNISDKEKFKPIEQDIESDIKLCLNRKKLNDANLKKYTFKYNIKARRYLKWWFSYLTSIKTCSEDIRQKLYEIVVLMPKADKKERAKHGPVFMSPFEVRKLFQIIKQVVLACYVDYYMALISLRLCGGRPGNETYRTYIADFELDKDSLLSDYMFGCGRWNLPAETSKMGSAPSHPDYGTAIFPFARLMINKHLQSPFMQKYIAECQKNGTKPLLFPPLLKIAKHSGIGSFSDRVYGDRFLKTPRYKKAISTILDNSHKGMYLIANDFRRTCAHLIENIEFKPIIRELRKMGANINLKHTLLEIVSYTQLRHSMEGMNNAHMQSYTCQEVPQNAYYYVVSKVFEFLMCDYLALNEEEANKKFDAWIATYFWPEEFTESQTNGTNNVLQNEAVDSIAVKETKVEKLKKEKADREQELSVTINDGSIRARAKRGELSEEIERLTKEIKKLEVMENE